MDKWTRLMVPRTSPRSTWCNKTQSHRRDLFTLSESKRLRVNCLWGVNISTWCELGAKEKWHSNNPLQLRVNDYKRIIIYHTSLFSYLPFLSEVQKAPVMRRKLLLVSSWYSSSLAFTILLLAQLSLYLEPFLCWIFRSLKWPHWCLAPIIGNQSAW